MLVMVVLIGLWVGSTLRVLVVVVADLYLVVGFGLLFC